MYLGVVVSAVVGCLISVHIYREKKKDVPMVCPLNFHCDTVVYSKYSKFFGIPVEVIGICYYAVVAISYTLFLFWPSVVNPVFTLVVLFATISAFLFSIYLTFVQVFRIKELCSWCLTSASICTVIFLLVAWSGRAVSTFVSLVAAYEYIIMLTNWVSMAIGFGGWILYGVLTLWFLRDLRISQEEGNVLHILRQIIIFAFGVIIITGVTLYFV